MELCSPTLLNGAMCHLPEDKQLHALRAYCMEHTSIFAIYVFDHLLIAAWPCGCLKELWFVVQCYVIYFVAPTVPTLPIHPKNSVSPTPSGIPQLGFGSLACMFPLFLVLHMLQAHYAHSLCSPKISLFS